MFINTVAEMLKTGDIYVLPMTVLWEIDRVISQLCGVQRFGFAGSKVWGYGLDRAGSV
jgi:hypothetical protein